MALTSEESAKLVAEVIRRRQAGLPPLFHRRQLDPEKLAAMLNQAGGEQTTAEEVAKILALAASISPAKTPSPNK